MSNEIGNQPAPDDTAGRYGVVGAFFIHHMPLILPVFALLIVLANYFIFFSVLTPD